MFNFSDLGFTHANNQRALSGLTLAAGTGERIAIIGPSGAGKTTLLRLLATSLRPSTGAIKVLGASPWGLASSGLRALRSRIGVIHQAAPIPPRQRAITAILAGRLGVWPWWKSAWSLVYPADIDGPRRALERLDLADRLFERCDRLSGGQLQRVGVARVLYQAPELILADEPVAAMDPALADQTVNQLIAESVSRGVTLVASLHAVDLALRWFPRVVGLRAGEIAFDLPPVRITDALLRELYSVEGGGLPTQSNRPLDLDLAGPRDARIPRARPLCS